MSLSNTKAAQIAYHKEVLSRLYDRINNVHKRPLHEGTIAVAKAFFNQGKRVFQSQWGRSGGKTESIIYIAWVYALLNSGVQIYIVTPQRKQGKDIYWASGRMQSFGPPEYVEQFKESELRVIFKNGSVITIDGCENYEALRGIKPNLVIYDEFQHHSRQFDVEVMQPNLIAKQASLLVFGTPPKRDCYYVEFRDRILDEIKAGDTTRGYLELPSWVNPSLDKAELDKTRVRLFKQGDEKVWYREYEAKLIFGGEDAVFPQWDPKKHVRLHAVIAKALQKDAHKLRWFTICDPGTTSVFAVLFAAYNPNTCQLFLLDEIYESDRKLTDSMSIWQRILAKEKELYPTAPPRIWRRYYDEAAAWFAREIRANFRDSLIPTNKQKNQKEDQISLIKAMMAQDECLVVSDRLTKLPWEIVNYVTDENGDLPDDHDHLVDAFSYLVAATNFRFVERDVREGRIVLPDHLQAVYSRSEQSIDPDEWADMAVNASLEAIPEESFYDT